jgi:hypothetical protein
MLQCANVNKFFLGYKQFVFLRTPRPDSVLVECFLV